MSTADAASQDPELLVELSELLAGINKSGVPITPETDFNADLNVDSVAVMDFVLMVEDRYDVSIPMNLLTEVRTVGEFAAVLTRARAG